MAGVGIVDVLELRRVGAVRFDGDRAHGAMLAEIGAAAEAAPEGGAAPTESVISVRVNAARH